LQFPQDIDRRDGEARPAPPSEAAAGPRRDRRRVLVVSLLIHAALIAGLWGVLADNPEPVSDAPVIAVDLVALARQGPPAPPQQDTEPRVQPQPQQPRTQPRRPRAETPPPQPVPTQQPDAAEPRPTQPAPAETPDVAGTPAPVEPAGALDAASAPPPAASGGGSSLTGDDAAAAKASYARLLLTRLQRAIVYPRRAQRRELEGIVRVEVVLAANGSLRAVSLASTSGHAVLDEAALDLVRRVAPFPPVPAALSPDGRDFAFIAPIQYRLN